MGQLDIVILDVLYPQHPLVESNERCLYISGKTAERLFRILQARETLKHAENCESEEQQHQDRLKRDASLCPTLTPTSLRC